MFDSAKFVFVFWNNAICEDEDYVYVSSSTYLIPTDKDKNIVKINKSDNSVTDLGIVGYNLNVYDGYLYFLNEHGMFKLDLSDANASPKSVTGTFMITYMILNSKIYPSGFLNPILSMNLDNTNKEEAKKGDLENYYYVCGYDERYVYAAFPYVYEIRAEDYVETNVQHLVRMDYNHENKEKLFRICTDFLAGLGIQNDYMIMLDGYAYYKLLYNGRYEIARNELVPNSEKELIYRASEGEGIEITAITRDGIYIKKFKIDDSQSYYHFRQPNTKLSIDGKTESQIEFKENVLFFVSRFDYKLHYIKDNKIFSVD